MNKVIPIRIAPELLEKIDNRCVIRKWNRTDVILDALRQSFSSPPEPVQQPARSSPLNIPGVFLGSQLGNPPEMDAESDQHPMCSYTEYDPQTGETYGCCLPAHTGKVKHQRGVRIDG